MKKLSIIIGTIILVIVMPLIFIMSYKFGIRKSVKIEGLNSIKYIQMAKKISNGKYNINWKEVAAISAVKNNNSFVGVKDEDIEVITKTFMNTSQNKAFSLEEVMGKLNFNSTEKRKVYKYIKDIENAQIQLPDEIVGKPYQIEFINEILQGAVENYENHSIMPSVTIAQAVIESDWGRSELSTSANNLFGIKADSSYDGAIETFRTKEYYDLIIDGQFRKYDSKNQSIKDHGNFLKENIVYRENGFFNEKSYKNQCLALENAGYATAENESGERIYADVLIDLIEKHKLYLIDVQVKNR